MLTIDITLHSRVLDYLPGMWEDLTYRQRKFFDWGDWLFARFDSKFDDRTTTTFVILGFWPDDKTLAKNEIFAEALARGFSRFTVFLGAVKLDVKGIPEPLLRRRAGSFIH